MIEREDPQLIVLRQCELLELPRSSYYRQRTTGSACNATGVNRKRVQRLMRQFGLEAIYRKPNTSAPHPEHRVYPYLLRKLVIDRATKSGPPTSPTCQSRAASRTCAPSLTGGPRRVLTRELSNTLAATFCTQAVRCALAEFGAPDIFNTDQGDQFTSAEFTQPLLAPA
jgi:putative transposase